MNELDLLMVDLYSRVFNMWVVGNSKEILENAIEIVSPTASLVRNFSLL